AAGRAAPVRRERGGAARGRRVARPLPALLGAAPRRARDRAVPRPPGAAARRGRRRHPRREEHPVIDVDEQVEAVGRSVGETGEVRTVTIARGYAAPVEDLWDACTTPERIARWFLPVSGDLREGGRYQLEGNAGGTIERCDPPHAFAATWEFAGA